MVLGSTTQPEYPGRRLRHALSYAQNDLRLTGRLFRASVQTVPLLEESFLSWKFYLVVSRVAFCVIVAIDVVSLWSISWIYRLRAHNRIAQTFCARRNWGVVGLPFTPVKFLWQTFLASLLWALNLYILENDHSDTIAKITLIKLYR
jgi:hypothetical protein